MQKKSKTGILQAGPKRKDPKNKREKVHRIPLNHHQSERKLIALVKSGELSIDEEGRIWRMQVRRGLKSGGSRIYPITPKRAEVVMPLGYMLIRGTVNGRRISGCAHRLVWQFYKGDIQDGYVINHLNGIKGDNRVSNLEVCTQSDNQKHAHRTGLIDQRGEKNPRSKISNREVVEIRLVYSQGSHTLEDLGKKYGVAYQTISDIVRGRTRGSQAGITGDYSHRRNRGTRKDPATGKFLKKGTIDGKVYQEWPV